MTAINQLPSTIQAVSLSDIVILSQAPTGGGTPVAVKTTIIGVGASMGLKLGPVVTPNSSATQSMFLGYLAGASYPLNATDDFFPSVAFGSDALGSLTQISAENVAIGAWAGQYFNADLGTFVGMHAGGSETTTGVTYIGNDSGRDAISGGYVVGVGQGSLAHGNPGPGVVGIGSQALQGNSSCIILSGTKTTGNTITIGATSSTAGLTGLPMSITYTVQSGDTMASIASHVANQVNGTIQGPSYGLECFSEAAPDGTYNIYLIFPGSTTSGWTLAVTASATGTLSASVCGGSNPTGVIAIGNQTAAGHAMTTPINSVYIGDSVASFLTTAAYNVVVGSGSGGSITTATTNTILGSISSPDTTTSTDLVTVGFWTGKVITTGSQLTIVGARSGQAATTANKSLILGSNIATTTFATGSGVILIGSGNVSVDTPLAATSNYINIENIIKVTGTGTPSTSVTSVAGAFALGAALTNAANDAAAATAGVAVNQFYRNGSIVMQRIT